MLLDLIADVFPEAADDQTFVAIVVGCVGSLMAVGSSSVISEANERGEPSCGVAELLVADNDTRAWRLARGPWK